MTSGIDRVAGAPISWGVCEVPGWGYQMQPDRVLAEMRAIGLRATELGSDGFLPATPEGKAETLNRYGLHGLGNFTPVVLHDPQRVLFAIGLAVLVHRGIVLDVQQVAVLPRPRRMLREPAG